MLENIDLTGIDQNALRQQLDRQDCEESLYKFLSSAWRYIDPMPWKEGWPIEAVADHLQAVVDGQIKRLIINIPPRMGKSSITSVAFPAWTWAQPERTATSGPGVQFLYSSYADKLSLRDSVKCRRLIESPWYQNLWGSRYTLTFDQNTKSRFSNDQGGERLITSIGAGVTGEGGSIIIADDPNSAGEAFSEAKIQTTIDWWTQSMSTRLNDMATGAYIIIQQRLAEDDLTGHILETNVGEWCHLMLPMRYEPDRSYFTPIGWRDPRTEPGELLWPERFSEESVVLLEKTLGPMIANGQLQQRPEPVGGGVIKRDYWQLWEDKIGDGEYPPMDFVLASLDTAYTTDTANDYSALTIWGIFTEGGATRLNRFVDPKGNPIDVEHTSSEGAPKVMLLYAWRDRLEINKLVETVAKLCRRTFVDLLIIENKAAGYSVAQEIRRLYGREKFGVQLSDPKSQDKLSRLYSVQHLFAEKIIYAPDKVWAEMVISEASQFPHSKHDDLTDTLSQALRHLRDNGLIARAPERLAEIEDSKRFHGNTGGALYEC